MVLLCFVDDVCAKCVYTVYIQIETRTNKRTDWNFKCVAKVLRSISLPPLSACRLYYVRYVSSFYWKNEREIDYDNDYYIHTHMCLNKMKSKTHRLQRNGTQCIITTKKFLFYNSTSMARQRKRYDLQQLYVQHTLWRQKTGE